MANRAGHRRFGSVRKLPSGRYHARYLGPDGIERTAPETFARKAEADRYLMLVEAQLARKEWIDPERGKVLLKDYAEKWIKERYHQPSDQMDESWNLDGAVDDVQLMAVALLRVADAPRMPSWKPGDEFEAARKKALAAVGAGQP